MGCAPTGFRPAPGYGDTRAGGRATRTRRAMRTGRAGHVDPGSGPLDVASPVGCSVGLEGVRDVGVDSVGRGPGVASDCWSSVLPGPGRSGSVGAEPPGPRPTVPRNSSSKAAQPAARPRCARRSRLPRTCWGPQGRLPRGIGCHGWPTRPGSPASAVASETGCPARRARSRAEGSRMAVRRIARSLSSRKRRHTSSGKRGVSPVTSAPPTVFQGSRRESVRRPIGRPAYCRPRRAP